MISTQGTGGFRCNIDVLPQKPDARQTGRCGRSRNDHARLSGVEPRCRMWISLKNRLRNT